MVVSLLATLNIFISNLLGNLFKDDYQYECVHLSYVVSVWVLFFTSLGMCLITRKLKKVNMIIYIEAQDSDIKNQIQRKRSKSTMILPSSLCSSFQKPNPFDSNSTRKTDMSLEQPFLDSPNLKVQRKKNKFKRSVRINRRSRHVIREHSNPNAETFESEEDERRPNPRLILESKIITIPIRNPMPSDSDNNDLEDGEYRFEPYSNTFSNLNSNSFTHRFSKREIRKSFKHNFHPNGSFVILDL